MKAVHEIKEAVGALSREELASFRSWFFEFDAEVWDRQFEEDVAEARLEPAFFEMAPAAQRLREPPELLASLPRLADGDAEAFASDIERARSESASPTPESTEGSDQPPLS